MKKETVLFEDEDVKTLLFVGVIFILLIGINCVLYYYKVLSEIFVDISLMVVYSFTALAILYQSLYTKRMVKESRRIHAWQIISGHLYHHIAIAIIVLKLVERNLNKLLIPKHVQRNAIARLFKCYFSTKNAPYIVQPYIRPRPGTGVGAGAEIYFATLPSFKEALEVLIRACTVLSEEDLKRDLEELRKQEEKIEQMLSGKESRSEELRNTLTQLKKKIKSASEKAESIFHIPITEPLLDGFQMV